MKEILAFLKNKHELISFAESMTGGSLVSSLTLESGASHILKESLVVYSNEAKIKHLNVQPETIDTFGVVSEAVVKEMVYGLSLKTKAHLCIATTGYAEGHNPNCCYVSILYYDILNVKYLVFPKEHSRSENIEETKQYVISEIKKILNI